MPAYFNGKKVPKPFLNGARVNGLLNGILIWPDESEPAPQVPPLVVNPPKLEWDWSPEPVNHSPKTFKVSGGTPPYRYKSYWDDINSYYKFSFNVDTGEGSIAPRYNDPVTDEYIRFTDANGNFTDPTKYVQLNPVVKPQPSYPTYRINVNYRQSPYVNQFTIDSFVLNGPSTHSVIKFIITHLQGTVEKQFPANSGSIAGGETMYDNQSKAYSFHAELVLADNTGLHNYEIWYYMWNTSSNQYVLQKSELLGVA